jgi:thiosulfate dehydrogenase
MQSGRELAWLLVGLCLGIGGVAVAVWWYFVVGVAPVAVPDHAMPYEEKLANAALKARMRKDHQTAPIQTDETNYLAGAKVYVEHCAMCHGVPGQPEPTIARDMYPFPTQLFHGKGVTNNPAWWSYWKVTNGIRLSGMPSFDHTLTDTQRWQVSVLVANAHDVSKTVTTVLTTPPQ